MSDNTLKIKTFRTDINVLKAENISLQRQMILPYLDDEEEMYLRGSDTEKDRQLLQKWRPSEKKITEIKNQIAENECKIKENELQIEKLEQEDKEPSFQGSGSIMLDINHQTIQIGSYAFGNFDSIFKLVRVKDGARKTQIKGGIALLYAIAKYGGSESNKNLMSISDLLVYCKEFKKNWNNRVFEKKGPVKKKITKTDCESAMTVLSCCGLSVKLKLSVDKNKISMVE